MSLELLNDTSVTGGLKPFFAQVKSLQTIVAPSVAVDTLQVNTAASVGSGPGAITLDAPTQKIRAPFVEGLFEVKSSVVDAVNVIAKTSLGVGETGLGEQQFVGSEVNATRPTAGGNYVVRVNGTPVVESGLLPRPPIGSFPGTSLMNGAIQEFTGGPSVGFFLTRSTIVANNLTVRAPGDTTGFRGVVTSYDNVNTIGRVATNSGSLELVSGTDAALVLQPGGPAGTLDVVGTQLQTASAGAASGQYLRIRVNGVFYKLALLADV